MNKKGLLLTISLLICMMMVMSMTSCSWFKGKKGDETKEAAKPNDSKNKTENELNVAKKDAPPVEDTTHGQRIPEGKLKKIYFDFDKFEIRADQKPILDENAAALIQAPEQKLLIEGNCDERGTIEYNLNLGDKRANEVKEYLKAKGVKNDIQVLSKGEEDPEDKGHTEEAWAKNRRAEFILIK